jgi:hypothetical protein
MGGQQGQPTTDTGTTPATKCCAALPVMAVVGQGEPREIRCMRVPRERAAVGHGAAERRPMPGEVLGERVHDDVGPVQQVEPQPPPRSRAREAGHEFAA